MAEVIRVLHVDDDPDFLEVTSVFLDRENDRFETVSETAAEDGLDRLADVEIDCVVSDYQMPVTDGLEFLEAVREDYPDLPFVLFTGEGSERIASEALSAGATEYLQKGSGSEHFELLANRIENAVDRHRAQERVTELELVRQTLADINQALVRASSREEVERRVCEILIEIEPIRFVVMSGVDPETGSIEARQRAGEDGGFIDDLHITLTGGTDGRLTPHERAVHEREVAGIRDVGDDPALDEWRESMIERGVRSLVVVPLEYDDALYGLLSLYGARPRPIDDDTRAILAELGDDIGIAVSAIESRRELEASESRYRTLTETVSDAILTIDESSVIDYANPAAEELFGYSREELRGAELTELMPERLHDTHHEGVERYLETGERQLDWTGVEFPGRHRDGSEIPLSISFGEFEHEGQQFFTGVIRDVTERVEQQAALKRRNEDLDEFAGIVAHDLRSPLMTAMGRLDIVREDHESEHLQAVEDQLDRMARLVDDLLTLVRQDQDAEQVEPIQFDEVVDDARQAVDGVTERVETDAAVGTIVGHENRVRVLVENLFRNALEHGGPDVRIRVSPVEGGFTVEDDGPGIPEDERSRVFDAGYTTKDDGTGFGLKIVEKIVDVHGWDIEVGEGSDGGASFRITGVQRPPGR